MRQAPSSVAQPRLEDVIGKADAMAAEHDDSAAARTRTLSARGASRERLSDLLRWHRIPGGLRYLRRYGTMALLLRLFPQLGFYRLWVRAYDTLTPNDVAAIRQHIRGLPNRPLISVLMPVASSDRAFPAPRTFLRFLCATLGSMPGQRK